jgi:hypothetical protein
MTTRRKFAWHKKAWALATCVSIVLVLCASLAPAQGNGQTRFQSPDEAIAGLAASVKARDREAIRKILGPKASELASGDEVRDGNDMEAFSTRVAEKVGVERHGETRANFAIGNEEWPFAIPVVKESDGWRFDTDAGLDELLSRRIGANEGSAILACRAYAVAQWEYFTTGDWDKDGVAEYAQRFRSSAGARDGLYWPSLKGEDLSPLGDLMAVAETAGYKAAAGGDPRLSAPFVGYRFKILVRQGPSAPGGSFAYAINGNMISGFALVAYPVKWGNSGIMTFMVNQQGRVYQKDLGPNTATIANAMEIYNPDATWDLAVEISVEK